MGSYVRDDELLESLRFSKNLIQVILLKPAQKAYTYVLPRIVQRVDEFNSFFKCNIYTLVLLWYNDLLKSLMVKSISCMGEPVDCHLKFLTSILNKFYTSTNSFKALWVYFVTTVVLLY